MFTVNRNPSPEDIGWFAAGFGLGLPILALLAYVLHTRSAAPSSALTATLLVLALAGVLLAATALAFPVWGRRMYVAWMTLTLPIGLVMSTLLLSLMYFLVLPVFSLIVRRRDPLRKKLGALTYWEDYHPHEPTIDRMRRPF